MMVMQDLILSFHRSGKKTVTPSFRKMQARIAEGSQRPNYNRISERSKL
jgi:hypothetical protein